VWAAKLKVRSVPDETTPTNDPSTIAAGLAICTQRQANAWRRAREPVDTPLLADFVDGFDPVNARADQTGGFAYGRG
jgi:hypothetical protein